MPEPEREGPHIARKGSEVLCKPQRYGPGTLFGMCPDLFIPGFKAAAGSSMHAVRTVRLKSWWQGCSDNQSQVDWKATHPGLADMIHSLKLAIASC